MVDMMTISPLSRRFDEVEVKVKLKLMAGTKHITMLDLRRRAEAIVRAVQRGQRMVLTYRGRPVLRLEPVEPEPTSEDDAFYSLADLADRRGNALTNEQIDKILYGSLDLR